MLRAVGVNLEIRPRRPRRSSARLVRKLRREDPQPQMERALELLRLLAETRGPPTMRCRGWSIVAAEAIDLRPIAELRAIVDCCRRASAAGCRKIVDFGLGRGLHYYTGSIFEILRRMASSCAAAGATTTW